MIPTLPKVTIFFSNKETDCVLYSEDGIEFNIHKEILGQTDFMRKIVSSIKTNCCKSIHVFCPCSKYELDILVNFLYTGKISCGTEMELFKILDILFNIFGFPKERFKFDLTKNSDKADSLNFDKDSFKQMQPIDITELEFEDDNSDSSVVSTNNDGLSFEKIPYANKNQKNSEISNVSKKNIEFEEDDIDTKPQFQDKNEEVSTEFEKKFVKDKLMETSLKKKN